jgi:hypothetical protein
MLSELNELSAGKNRISNDFPCSTQLKLSSVKETNEPYIQFVFKRKITIKGME